MKSEIETESRTGRKALVLLVEDNPLEERLIRANFKKLGSTEFDLRTATYLSDALSVLAESEIDIVLLDLILPDSAGLKTLQRIRESAPEVPVVVLTGLDDEGQALQALKAGAQDYLIKGHIGSAGLFRVIRYAIERKQAETERRKLEYRLLQGHKLEALGTLAGGVAHNFNNTLMAILGRCELMLDPSGSEDSTERHVQSIKKSAERAAALTRQLLTFSRKETMRSCPAVMNPREVVLEMQVLIESMLSSDIELQLNLPADTGSIEADAHDFGQMIMNIVVNARDAMGESGKLIIQTTNAGNSVVLAVTDNGCGMNPETVEHIFEPFFTTKGLAQASGLGLAAVYGIVKQYGGTVEVFSRAGLGTTFQMTFPRSEENAFSE